MTVSILILGKIQDTYNIDLIIAAMVFLSYRLELTGCAWLTISI
jgi:uncharacterized membrane protein YqjE